MMTATTQTLQARAERMLGGLADLLRQDWRIEVIQSVAQAGSGSLPLEEIPSIAITVVPAGLSAGDLATRLRRSEPAILGYVRDDRQHLDMRTVTDDEVPVLGHHVDAKDGAAGSRLCARARAHRPILDGPQRDGHSLDSVRHRGAQLRGGALLARCQ